MREHKLDCVIVPGGPSHWSFGEVQWLTGHWEWHAIASYVLVPLDGEPTLIFSMGGTHAEACRRECANALTDVRHSRSGKYAEVMVERLKELKLERARIGLVEVDARHADYLPVNQYNVLRQSLPDAQAQVFTKGFLHELVVVHSEEELLRAQGRRAVPARDGAMIARAKPGVPEYELRAAAGAAILDGGGDIDLPHHRDDAHGRAGHGVRQPASVASQAEEGRHHQHGARGRLQRPLRADRLADHARPAERNGAQVLGRDHAAGLPEDHSRDQAGQRHRQHAARQPLLPRCRGVQSRPTQVHGIDIVTDKPTSSPSAPRPTRSTRCSSPA